MLLIECPWCGPRAEIEFSCGGEANIRRPAPSAEVTDSVWADYLFMRKNPRGPGEEQWLHAQGCRRWFKLERDTVTYEILRTSRFGSGPAASDGAPEDKQ
ncbi:sarcosine oxidase subunit delta [Bordetella flabilis]|uniref:Sarcosine oxidase subunit delta n=1 Tax=Bordetella flabilis TaxID=463014 RepID=A0A193GL46_9BORD|nr:sarcosine oxidase subunit delta [Bordetella flabilis]ANN79989.1 sarcosine oxidase subunit delta [Bordetella flabilis]